MSRFAKFAAVGMAAAIALSIGPASAQDAKPEEILKMRQGIFQAVRMNFGPLGGVARGNTAFGPEAVERAEALAALAKVAAQGFPAGSDNIPGSNTKPAAFQDASFGEKMEAFGAEAAKLAQLGQAGDEAGFKAQIAAVGGSCKACHDSFRN
ncbi:cytochrome c [Telmatospirillum sp. J64-1]|uniref:c-type cytochrome n=1 Tax=Telmatospirillum sp. J64-1 TaxID=2502183 RepID=UPI00115CFE48|nr:cytochrome c [Telmatospirillum sp. J64-1]